MALVTELAKNNRLIDNASHDTEMKLADALVHGDAVDGFASANVAATGGTTIISQRQEIVLSS